MVRVLLPRNIIHLYYTIDLKFFQVLKIKKDEREYFLTKHSLSLANNTASICKIQNSKFVTLCQ